MTNLQSNSDGLYFLEFEWGLLTNNFSFVPWGVSFEGACIFHDELL